MLAIIIISGVAIFMFVWLKMFSAYTDKQDVNSRLQANLDALTYKRYEDFAVRWETSIFWVKTAFEDLELEKWSDYQLWTRQEFLDWYDQQDERYFLARNRLKAIKHADIGRAVDKIFEGDKPR